MNTSDIIEMLEHPSQLVLDTVWENIPSPIDIDTKEPDALRLLCQELAKVLKSQVS